VDQRFELVAKIGSMALIRKEDKDIDYNIFARLGRDLKPGMILITSGATEIGRLDYLRRTGRELTGDSEQDKADYAAQGQAIVMELYRRFVSPEYGIRQVLVEHTHFNDPVKRDHIHRLLLRAACQGAVPIINYNDPVSDEENRKLELYHRRLSGESVYECVDNDETASVIAGLVRTKTLVLMTSTEGIYRDTSDPATLVRDLTGDTIEEVECAIRALQEKCIGASRAGANGARAKLEYALRSVKNGTTVIIGHARHHLADLVEGNVPCTRIGLKASMAEGGMIPCG